MTWFKWSKTAANNATADATINWAEGQSPSSVNDSARAEMAANAKYFADQAGSLLTTGTATAYTLTSNATFDTLAHLDGFSLKVRFHTASGAAPTLNVDGLGAKALQIASGTALTTGMIAGNSVWDVTYDNSIPAFLVSGVPAVTAAGTANAASIAFAAGSKLLGSSSSGAGNGAEITLGTGLLMSSTTLSVAPPPQGSFKNLSIKVASNTTVTVVADAVATTDGTAYQTTAVSATCNLGTNGAVNALDAGTIAIDTWYAIWVIAKTDGTTGTLASTSATAPTLPTGYTFKARVGWVRTIHATATLYGTWQFGRRAQYVVGLAQTTAAVAIASGTAGTSSATAPVWATPSVAAFVPTTATEIGIILANQYNGGASSTAAIAPSNSYSGEQSASPPFMSVAAASQESKWGSMLLEATTIAWFSSAAGGAILCTGWIDNI